MSTCTSRARVDSRRAIVEGEPFNWQYRKLPGLPYGEPASKECVNIAQTTSTDDPTLTEAEGYVLFQNQPNPIPLSLAGFTAAFDGPAMQQSDIEERQRQLEEFVNKNNDEFQRKLREEQEKAKQAAGN